MARERLATASYELIVATPGAEAQIASQIVPAADKAGRKAGKKLGESTVAAAKFTGLGDKFQQAGGKISKFGGNLTKWVTAPAAGAAAAVGGIALAAGWKRLTSIENAGKSLEGLGYSAKEASDIIKVDVLKAVEGTAFSLQEAGSSAAGALGAGVQAGEELTRWMTMVGDATQQSTTDYGSMADMLAKVKGTGKLTGSVIQQMTENGLYIVPMLSKEFGKTADEIYEMASAGEISADMMQQALENQIGGSAKKAGDTTEGALANMKTAFGNLGATVLEEVVPHLKTAMDEVTTAFKSPEMKEFAADLGQKVVDTFLQIKDAVMGAVDWWKNLSPEMQTFVKYLGATLVVAGPVLKVVGSLTGVVGGLFKATGTVIGGVAKFTGALVANATAASGTLGETLALKAMYAGDFVKSAAKAVAGIAAQTGAWIANSAALVAHKVAAGVSAAAQWALNAAMSANPIMLVVVAIGAIVAALVAFFTKTEAGKKAWQSFMDFLGAAWEWMKRTWDQCVKAVTDTFSRFQASIKTIGAAISAWWTSFWDGVKRFFTGIWNGIRTTGVNVFTALRTGITNIGNSIKSWWTGLWDGIKGFFSRTWDGIKSTGQKSAQWLKDKVMTPINGLKTAAVNAFTGMRDGIDKAWSGLKSVAAKPVNFVIETVYTNGLKKFVESVVGKLGLKLSLPSVSPIKLNRGGQLPGFGGGDRIPTILEAGEFVINKYAARQFHPLLAAINGGYGVAPGTVGASTGCGGGSCGIPGLSKGGWLSGIGDFFSNAAQGVGAFLRDPLGSVAELITKPVKALLGGVDSTVWGDLGRGAIQSILDIVPNWFKKKSEGVGNQGLVGAAAKAIGVPYIWGGSTIPPGLDCSGLVYWAAQQLGLGWPRLTAAGYQSQSNMKSMSSAVPGDLLFWGNPASHIAIYTGPGQMIHAPKPGTYVTAAGIYGSPSVGVYRGGSGQTYDQLLSKTVAKSRSADAFARNLRASQYDSGGDLLPGWTLAYNGTGKVETIRTHEQEQALRGGIRDVYFQIDLDGVRELAEATDALKTIDRKLRMGRAR